MSRSSFIQIHTQPQLAQAWLSHYQGKKPLLALVLGFTDTGLLPGISAAGATPESRRYTAIADAEFLLNGVQPHPHYPLPPLDMGVSPAFISRTVVESLHLPVVVMNAGLPVPPAIAAIDLGGKPAYCLSTGKALDLSIVEHLFHQGMIWGAQLASLTDSYLMLAECVVGGTTTALAVLTALGIAAQGKVNSSHPTCNHQQKWLLVERGLQQSSTWFDRDSASPGLNIVAAVGDPMQIVTAGLTIAASQQRGVLLAGGTQMLAVYALAKQLVIDHQLDWNPQQIVVGTTRWVASDPTGDTVGLAQLVNDVPLLASQVSFATSRFTQLQAYEQGFVKEGVGAGGCAIAAHLYHNWDHLQLLRAIENLLERYQQTQQDCTGLANSHSDKNGTNEAKS